MVCIHVLSFYGQPDLRTTIFGYVFNFLGRAPAAPVFMFTMGVFIGCSRSNKISRNLKRAVGLFVLGYLLNLFRGSLPVWLSLQMGLVSYDQLDGVTPITEFFIVDIFQFAGLALSLCVLCRRFFPNPLIWLVVALGVSLVSPLLWPVWSGVNSVDGFLKLLWGGKYNGAMFPLFPWLAYPLCGMAFGFYLLHWQGNFTLFYRYARIAGLGLILIGASLVVLNADTEWRDYPRTPTAMVLFNLGFIVLWLEFCRFLVTTLQQNRYFDLLYFWSRHLTLFYIIQWLVVGWGLIVVGSAELAMATTVFAMLVVLAISDACLRFWLHWTGGGKALQ